MSGLKISAMVLAAIIIAGFLGYTLMQEVNAFRSLKIELIDASITRIGLTSCDLSLKLRLTNPVRHDTPLLWIDSYSIYINENYVGAGKLTPVKVPASSTIYETTTISIEYAKIARGLAEAIMKGEVKITIKGELKAKILFNLIPASTTFNTTYHIH
jgi:LEA14-like dessication related protein